MAALAKNPVGAAGLRVDTLLAAAAGGGDTAPTGKGVFLLVQNTSGASMTVTIGYPGKYDGDQTVSGRTFTIAATTGLSTIPLRDVYRSPTTGLAAITYSLATNVKVAVVAVP